MTEIKIIKKNIIFIYNKIEILNLCNSGEKSLTT